MGGIADAVKDAASTLSAIGSLFGLNAPAPPQSKEEAQDRRDKRVQKAIDSERLLHDRAYRREYEQQQRAEREREAEERERERKRRDDRQR